MTSLFVLLICLCYTICTHSHLDTQPGGKFDIDLAKLALEYAAASYADDPWPCLRKNGASLVVQVNVPCDAVRDKCWAIVVNAPEHIVVAFQGTSSRTQLITELIESITSPKHQVPGIGSVQRYFYIALLSIMKPLSDKLNKLRDTYPDKDILFTGHSLGGALASLAAALYANGTSTDEASKVYLVTFGQPRVGNHEYAQSVDRLVRNSWRLVHKYDLVAHVPYCVGLRTCSDFLNHSPYHHGTEVWFPGEMGEHDLYQVCDGEPLDEDAKCSNSHYFYNVDDHLNYFGHHVSDYGIDGCKDIGNVTKTEKSDQLNRTRFRVQTQNRKRYRTDRVDQKRMDISEREEIMLITEAAMMRWVKDYMDYLRDLWHTS